MKHPRLFEEVQRTLWAMNIGSIRAMLSFFEDDLSADDYSKFHVLSQDMRAQIQDTFGRTLEGSHYASIVNNVGFLMVSGPMVPRANAINDVSGMTSLDILGADFKALDTNPAIDTIATLYDTPGGATKGIADYTAIVKASSKKTVSFAWCAASLGYWAASASQRIVAPPDGIVGSIGVVGTVSDFSKADEKKGIRRTEIISTYAPEKRPDPTTEEGRAVLKARVDEMEDLFLGAIAENRGTTKENVIARFGKGATVLAHRALDARMIDAVQTADEFAKSIIKTESTYQLHSISATADNTQTEVSIMDVKTLKAEHADIHEEIVASAKAEGKAEEQTRLKGIEALYAKFESSPKAVRNAAFKTITEAKYEDGATAESVSGQLLDSTLGAQAKALDDFADPRREAAKTAEELSAANPPEAASTDPDAADEGAIDVMLNASKSEGRIK